MDKSKIGEFWLDLRLVGNAEHTAINYVTWLEKLLAHYPDTTLTDV